MRQFLHLTALLLIVGWFFGAFVLALGSLVHLLIVFAMIALLAGFIRGENT